MNRAERRRNKIKTHEAMISVKRSDIAQIKKQATEEAMRVAMTLMLGITIAVLREHYGWGKKRLAKMGEHLIDMFEAFEHNEMSLEDFKKLIYESCGISFEVEEDR